MQGEPPILPRKFESLKKYIGKDKSHLFAYIISILTKNQELLEQMFRLNEYGGLSIQEIISLLHICKEIKWADGIICILDSVMTKNIFVMADLQNKYALVSTVLDVKFAQQLVPPSVQDSYM